MVKETSALIDPSRPAYDVALEEFEKGMTSARVDEIFTQVCYWCKAEDMHMGVIVARVDKRIMRVSAAAPLYSHCHVQPYMDTVGLPLCMAQLLKSISLKKQCCVAMITVASARHSSCGHPAKILGRTHLRPSSACE